MAKFVTHASAHSTHLINGFIDINLMTFCVNAFHLHTETYRESPDPSFPVRDTESDPCWGWLGLACETSWHHGVGFTPQSYRNDIKRKWNTNKCNLHSSECNTVLESQSPDLSCCLASYQCCSEPVPGSLFLKISAESV